LAGVGADFGCGVGLLALKVLESVKVTALLLVDIDRRAIAAARLNVADRRATFLQADLTTASPLSPAKAGVQEFSEAPVASDKKPGSPPSRGRAEPHRVLDFVVMNPPFHDGGAEDRTLGQAFIRRAAKELRQGGTLKLVANIGLPYEAPLRERFADLRLLEQAGGYKVYEARRR
jgi:16S rRNA (guanine1207-N2)-methyltransferase